MMRPHVLPFEVKRDAPTKLDKSNVLTFFCFPRHQLTLLLNGKFLDCSKLKAFADDKSNLAKRLKFDLGRVENISGKGENAGYQHFLLFPQCF